MGGVAPDTSPLGHAYHNFVQARAAELRLRHQFPGTLANLEEQKITLRRFLANAWGEFPNIPAPLQPRIVGVLMRDGYRVEKLVFQTFPGVEMTANAYVPEKSGRHPAVLAVHGHWRGAKQDPVVQARAIGLVKQGFFVFVVDAFGAGERGIGKELGEYHGEMTAATLLPIGRPLSGLQVYENMRAVDYLLTRPEVDSSRIGITGASGGGNQTMYASAWDDRLVASVPVCSVGNYAAYLGSACCLCEVVPGILGFAEEWAVLGLTAPRALLVVSATRDSPVFSAEAARVSMEPLSRLYALGGHPDRVRHAIFDSGHDYNQAMREAMYAWMTRHLKQESGSFPVSEPPLTTEDPEILRCFPGESRPDEFVALPRFAAEEARRLNAARLKPKDRTAWENESWERRASLLTALGGMPAITPGGVQSESREPGARRIAYQSEPGISLVVYEEASKDEQAPIPVLLEFETVEGTRVSALARQLREAGWGLIIPELRATGRHAWANDKVGSAPDHNTAQWGLWLGRPLLGQWMVDVRRALDALKLPPERNVILLAPGSAGVVAIVVAALDSRIDGVAVLGSLASYVSDAPYQGQRMGIFAPGILRDAGDLPHLMALIAPRKLVIAGAVDGRGRRLETEESTTAFAFTRSVYSTLGSAESLQIQRDSSYEWVMETIAR